ncbi:MAG: beta-lactamase family protein [Bacteroidia bacterium]|nr:beta-lactamase family protein [Bacteroidia bacterium]
MTPADSLTAEIGKIYDRGVFNGFAVAIVDEKGTLYQQGFGFADISAGKPYTIHTIQNIASVSKTLVGIVLLKAQELGKLRLDDPIDRYLPFSVENPAFPGEKITLRQLATHTSSIVDNEYYLTKNYILKPDQDLNGLPLHFDEQVFNPQDSAVSLSTYLGNVLSVRGKWYDKSSFTAHKPGSMYEYSNTGTALAALVIERATGKSFAEFTNEHILGPLGMHVSGWINEDLNASAFSRLYADPNTPLPYYELITYPDGGLVTSVHDLGKFLSELIRGYKGKGTVLTKKGYREYFRPQLTAAHFTERSANNPYDESYNSGIFIGFGHTGYIGHTGGDPGVVSMMFFDRETGLGRIMIFNTNFSDKAGNDAFFGIWDLLGKYQSRLRR